MSGWRDGGSVLDSVVLLVRFLDGTVVLDTVSRMTLFFTQDNRA